MPPTNTLPSNEIMPSTSDIKRLAMYDVKEETRGFPALTLISCARLALASAKTLEANGYLRDALRQYAKTSCLIKQTLDSREYKVQRSRAVQMAFDEFMLQSQDLPTCIVRVSDILDSAQEYLDKTTSWPLSSHRGLPGGSDRREAVVASTLIAVREYIPPPQTKTSHIYDAPCLMSPRPNVQWARRSDVDATSQLLHIMGRRLSEKSVPPIKMKEGIDLLVNGLIFCFSTVTK